MFANLLIICSIFIIFHSIDSVQEKNKKIFCNYWSISTSLEKSEISQAESLCTHIIYTNFGITDDGYIKSLHPRIDLEENNGRGYIKRFNDKKKYNKILKTLATVGGWEPTEKSKRYSDIFADENNQKRFAKSSLEFLMKHNFDGLILHWPYPGLNGGNPVIDKFTFTALLKKVKEELSKKNLILVAICHGSNDEIDDSYNIKDVAQNVDYVLLSSYDFYGDWSSHVGIASALYLHPTEIDTSLSTDSIVNTWIDGGAPPEKIIMGLPLFGRTFTLRYENQTSPGSQYISAGYKTKLNAPGFMTYVEICQRLNKNFWTIRWEETQKNPYAFKGNQWVGFENPRSLEIKAKYVIDKNLGGVGVSSLDLDDNKGICGVENILLKELNSILLENIEYKYILDTRVLKKNLDTNSTECVYHNTKRLDLLDTYLFDFI